MTLFIGNQSCKASLTIMIVSKLTLERGVHSNARPELALQ